ncbi:hypothetical protein KTD31_02365 [Burkholderia multivorans]|nr:hypothetical protein [Burkholderia multivorans]MDN8078624.1 hypothetical protein [Burkholderia multivorans]
MAMTEKQLESALLSMTGTLIYLKEMANTLNRKPVLPTAVSHLMPDTAYKVGELQTAFDAAEMAARAEAQPLLEEWQARVGLVAGGILRATTFSRFSGSHKAEVTGGIVSAKLNSYLAEGLRVVVVRLEGAAIRTSDGRTYASLADMPERFRYQSEHNFNALADATYTDTGGAKVQALHVLVPIQAKQRTEWARRGNLEML